jgi:hypothetical protein
VGTSGETNPSTAITRGRGGGIDSSYTLSLQEIWKTCTEETWQNFVNTTRAMPELFFLMSLPAYWGPWPLIQFRNHFSQTVGLLGRVISPSQGNYLNTRKHKHRINAYTHQTSTPSVGFESTLPASERAKTGHASDRAATVTGVPELYRLKIPLLHVSGDRNFYLSQNFRLFEALQQ